MPVSAWCYLPTSLPQEQAAKTKMLSVERIQQKGVTSRLLVSIYCLPSTNLVQIWPTAQQKKEHKSIGPILPI